MPLSPLAVGQVNPTQEKQVQQYRFHYAIVLVLALVSAACSEPAVDNATIQLSYEAIPGTGVPLGQGAVNLDTANYDDKLAFTQDVHRDLVPEVFAQFGLEFTALASAEAPGGYLLETNPSMQSRGAMTSEEATQVSAGLGYVMYQWSVLVTDFTANDGDTAYGIVQFNDGELNGVMAQMFFEHAASVNSGLGGGYMSFNDEMIFLNLRGSDGMPYSGLDDDTFIAQLDMAASSFAGAATSLSVSDFASAWLVENDWGSAPTGADYAGVIEGSGASIEALDGLQAQYNEQLLEAATLYGWDAQPSSLPEVAPQILFPWYNQHVREPARSQNHLAN